MRNLADAIENFIVRQLLEGSEETVLVQRNELADKLSCAPSQISYVLSTRFTPEKGYLVESRRGSGGFVRIVRVTPPNNEKERRETAQNILDHWAQRGIVTSREYALLKYMLEIINADEKKKITVLQNAISKMMQVR